MQGMDTFDSPVKHTFDVGPFSVVVLTHGCSLVMDEAREIRAFFLMDREGKHAQRRAQEMAPAELAKRLRAIAAEVLS